MFYGLAAALGFGLADLLAAISGRRIGAFLTVMVAQSGSLVALAASGLLLGEPLHASRAEIVILLANGIFAAAAYVTLYRALELGPVALVSPIVAAYAAITVVLAVALLHESLRGFVLVGTVTTLAGAALASGDLRSLGSHGRLLKAGVPWALVSMVLFGVATYVLGRYSQSAGWYTASLLSRIGNTAAVLVFVWFVRSRLPRRPGGMNVALALGVGLADILGVMAFARGAELGFVSVVTAATAAFIIIPVAGGLLMYKERPAPNQALGVAMVGLGLVFLGLG